MKKTAPRKKKRQPLQPLYVDDEGTIRFQGNAIVRYLLDSHKGADMNTLSLIPFPLADREQFLQLIGYSVSGFQELSYVRNVTYQRAEKAAAPLRAELAAAHLKK